MDVSTLNAQDVFDHTYPHVVCVGFMGAGKTVVGKALAHRLGYNFIDTDDEIERVCGQSVASFFQSSGEEAFRLKEQEVIRAVLKRQQRCVISVGGGAFQYPPTQRMLLEETTTVFLDVSLSVLEKRLLKKESIQKRPLLQTADPLGSVRSLFEQRYGCYKKASLWVRVHDEHVDAVVSNIHRLLTDRMDISNQKNDKRIRVSSSLRAYDVVLSEHLDEDFLRHMNTYGNFKRIAIVSDKHVASLHVKKLQTLLESNRYSVSVHIVEPGESSKSMEVAGSLCEELSSQGFGRKDLLVALGGGVVGDLTGFVASVFMRGVAYVHMPTTTLACVDSSVGGKTAVNTPYGKNLIGSFYPPYAVYVVFEHVRTQQVRMHSAGLVEAVKMAFTMDRAFFEWIGSSAEKVLQYEPKALGFLFWKAIRLKADVVARDEHEQGDRAVLNFGHTVGHAIESGEEYRLLHGEAVSLGMLAEQEFCAWSGVAPSYALELRAVLEKIKAPVDMHSVRVSTQALMQDKKREHADIVFPTVPEIGRFDLPKVPLSKLVQFVHERMLQ